MTLFCKHQIGLSSYWPPENCVRYWIETWHRQQVSPVSHTWQCYTGYSLSRCKCSFGKVHCNLSSPGSGPQWAKHQNDPDQRSHLGRNWHFLCIVLERVPDVCSDSLVSSYFGGANIRSTVLHPGLHLGSHCCGGCFFSCGSHCHLSHSYLHGGRLSNAITSTSTSKPAS